MLQRFYLIKNCILKTLIDIKYLWLFGEEELSMIYNLVTILEPVNLAVETLCRRDAALLSADTTMLFLLHNLGTNDIAVQLKEALSRRINERRTEISSLLQYLHKRSQHFTEMNPLIKFKQLKKTEIVSIIAELEKPFQRKMSVHAVSENDDDEVDEEVATQWTLKEQLEQAIKKDINLKILPRTITNNVTKLIKKEPSKLKAIVVLFLKDAMKIYILYHLQVLKRKEFFLVMEN